MYDVLRQRLASLLGLIAMVKMYLIMLEQEAQELAEQIEAEDNNDY